MRLFFYGVIGETNYSKSCGGIRMKAIVYEEMKNVKVRNIGDPEI